MDIIHVPQHLARRLLLNYINFSKLYDLVISDGLSALPTGWLMKKVGLCKKLAFITTSHAFVRFPTIFNLFLMDVDLVIATSSLMYSIVKEIFNFNGKIVVCHPIPELKDFFKIKPCLDSRKICFIGSLAPHKGVDFLPEIVAKVRRKIKEVEIYVVGKGIIKVSEGIKVLGFIPHGEKLLLLSQCSLYLHPARFDAFGVSVIEAMAAGLIPVVTEMTGSKDIVREVSSNLIVPVNIDAIADKIIEILSMDYNERVKISEKAKKVAQSFVMNAEKHFVQIIKDIL